MTERELLTAGLRELGVAECPSAADNLLRYSEILREKNKVMNLTAITDPTEIVTRHFLDCAALTPYMPQDGRVLDVGTGAGFPGMPLAILCPQTEFVLLDALRKRIDFLNEVITDLGLTNVTAVHARAEDYARDNRGTFDLAVSRAVADLRVLSELALPMVKVGGAFLAMKAEDCTEEVEAESISYAVCQYFGIQTGENSFGYIASWSKGKELKELRASLETINKTSCELINDIERHYKEICKERGIDLTAKQEPEQADIPQEALFLLNDATYLHIQPCDTGWDYTLYDKETMKELDGGQLDTPELSRSAAVQQICEGLELENPSVQDAPLSMIETLQDAACQQMQEQVSQQTTEATATQLPDAQEQSLDEYPMPDSEVSVSDMQGYGYFYDGMLPVTKERALELDAAGLTIYVLHEDNTESMVFDTEEIMEHGGLFGVEHEEWEQSPAFHEKVLERQERQMEREQAFLAHEGSCFAIYQVSRDDPQNVRFMNLDWLQSHNLAVDRNNYDLIYTASMNGSGSTMEQLETLYEQFNLQKLVDFHSPSLSVSDIVAIKQDGKVSCHYCDSVGFTEIPGFLPDNPLKNAEMMLEDDYGMIDGIINNGPKELTVAQLEQQARSGQPISLMDLAAAAIERNGTRKSPSWSS